VESLAFIATVVGGRIESDGGVLLKRRWRLHEKESLQTTSKREKNKPQYRNSPPRHGQRISWL